MYSFYADDSRILTPPQELKPRLKGSFPAFSKLLGHIRFFYVADEVWDGKSILVFKAGGDVLAAVKIGDGVFNVNVGDGYSTIVDGTMLNHVYKLLKTAHPDYTRSTEQLIIPLDNPNQFPCGRRCDLCLGSKESDEIAFSPSENFGYMNWVCYHNCVPKTEVERWDGVFKCPGCAEIRKTPDCKYFACPTGKGYANCAECGEYHSCEVYRDCHYPGQCNHSFSYIA